MYWYFCIGDYRYEGDGHGIAVDALVLFKDANACALKYIKSFAATTGMNLRAHTYGQMGWHIYVPQA